ncbi:MAG: trimeric intracellular cation channel family protein [Clostridia bacterium]|nr:trimeric intracellular cation channel family protein [Clostridia bacterium]
MINEVLIVIMEWIGTAAFAVSGALVAIGCGLDLFGVVIVGCVTAVGGGMMRDLLIGNVPPLVFGKPEILLCALITTLAVFILSYINSKRFSGIRQKIEKINILFDALGLASFSVTGVVVACEAGYESSALLAITLGVITGVGGGILRDVLVNEKPYVLTKHIYAVASIVGSSIYYVMGICFGLKVWGTFISLGFTIFIRLLAAHFRWKLPKVPLE